MKESRKKVLGVFGLIFVIAMTVFAYTLPDPEEKILSEAGEPVALGK